jgi:hypothetical protein
MLANVLLHIDLSERYLPNSVSNVEILSKIPSRDENMM